MRTAALPGAAYDLWHDRALFHFLTEPADRTAYLRQLRHALKPTASVIIAAFAPDGPTRCSGLPVCRYSPADLARELGPGFVLLESAQELHRTPAGSVQSFTWACFRRSETQAIE